MTRREFLERTIAALSVSDIVCKTDSFGGFVPTEHNNAEYGKITWDGDNNTGLIFQTDTTLGFSTRMNKCQFTGRRWMDRLSDLTLNNVAGPTVLVEEFCKRFGNVEKDLAKRNLTLWIGSEEIVTLSHVVIQSVGWTAITEGFSVVTELSLMGIWDELQNHFNVVEPAKPVMPEPTPDFILTDLDSQ